MSKIDLLEINKSSRESVFIREIYLGCHVECIIVGL